MKLATLKVKEPSDAWEAKDGRLVVVDDDAGQVALVPDDVATTLFGAMQSWSEVAPQLETIAAGLKAGTWSTPMALADCQFMAPLPRTTCWLDGSAYVQHIVLVRKARGVEPPEDLRQVPLMYQGASDPLYGPNDDIVAIDEAHGIDLEAEVAVILDEVPMGTKAADASRYIRLICLMNDVSLRNLIPRELKAGFGFFHGKPPSHFGPYAVTPDELGEAWKDGRVHLDMESWINGERLGNPNAGPEMFFGFNELIEHAATTRPLPAGTILGSGTVSNEDESRGCSCLAERRMLETIHDGKPATPFLKFGDHVRIDMQKDGRSIFGVIDQKVAKYQP